MSRRRRWYEPYRKTFRATDKASGAWLNASVECCPINGTCRTVGMSAGRLPATTELPTIYGRLLRQAQATALPWRARMLATFDES